MTTRPHLLLTNDDGIHAPGLRCLWTILSPYFDLTVVAPATEKSGVGCSTSVHTPLYLKEHEWAEGANVWSVSGTPVDCIKLSTHTVMKQKPDMVISGINPGSNAGRNIFYSGTVGGAIEAANKGIPAIAFSCESWDSEDFSLAEAWVAQIVTYFLEHPIPLATILNVNFPHVEAKDFKGVRLATQGKGHFKEFPERRTTPYGHPYYWLGSRLAEVEEPPHGDVALMREGYATVVPISLQDLTHHQFLQAHTEGFLAMCTENSAQSKKNEKSACEKIHDACRMVPTHTGV